MKKTINWPLVKLAISGTLTAIFVCLWWLVHTASTVFIDQGNKPHKPDDINGLFAAGGYVGDLLAYVPLLLAMVCLVISILYIIKLRNYRQIG